VNGLRDDAWWVSPSIPCPVGRPPTQNPVPSPRSSQAKALNMLSTSFLPLSFVAAGGPRAEGWARFPDDGRNYGRSRPSASGHEEASKSLQGPRSRTFPASIFRFPPRYRTRDWRPSGLHTSRTIGLDKEGGRSNPYLFSPFVPPMGPAPAASSSGVSPSSSSSPIRNVNRTVGHILGQRGPYPPLTSGIGLAG